MKVYLDSDWLRISSEAWTDFVTDLIYSEGYMPVFKHFGMEVEKSYDLDVAHCYFDDKCDLYLPQAYDRVKDEFIIEADGTETRETEIVPCDYKLFKTKAELLEGFEAYKVLVGLN